jgi:glycosyltransferase involved in cell wall biosynthesis
MINIAICESGSGGGGSAAFLFAFLKILYINIFHPIIVCNKKGDGFFIQKIKDLNIEILNLSDDLTEKENSFCKIKFIKHMQIVARAIKNNLNPIIKLVSFIKKRNIDLMFLNQDVVLHMPAIFVSFVLRKPCIVRKSGMGVHPSAKIWQIYSLFSRIPDHYIAISNAEYNFHIESKFHYRKMSIIYPGVDVSYFQTGITVNRIHDEYGLSRETMLIGVISRLDFGKGHEDIIAAAAVVLKEYHDAAFIIVGDGEAKKSLIEQVRLLGLQGKVIFTGWRTNTREILNEIDIFVHCPNKWREGMGIATLEALASGKPVVITDNLGLSDTTQDDYNGFKVQIGNIALISEKILLLLKDQKLRTEMGNNSRKRALELFDIHKNIKKMEDIMCDLYYSGKY